MKTIIKPRNPFSEKFIDEISGIFFRDRRWEAWEQCREVMDEYYREALQDPIGLLVLAEAELITILDGDTDDVHQVLIFVKNAKDRISKAVKDKEG